MSWNGHHHEPGPPRGSGEEPPRAPGIELADGQRVSATVVELLGDGQVLVGVRGVKIVAAAQVPLELGRTYTFLVQGDRDRVRLTLAGRRPPGDTGPGPGGLVDVKG